MRRTRYAMAAVLCAACNAGQGGGFGVESAGAGTALTSLGDDGGGSESGSDDGEDDSSGGAMQSDESGSGGDGGSEDTQGDGDPLPTEPCTAIDLVFVVDDTDTMATKQLALVAAAGGWIEQINANTPTVIDDIRIGVITTDDPVFAIADGMGTACGPYASGERWMTIGETLPAELPCALHQGTTGDPDERPADMLREALAPQVLAPGGVHDGFLRDDALLVVVILTDEEDDYEPVTAWGSQDDPADWVAALAGLKEGHVGNVVVIALVGHEQPNACPAFQWNGSEGAEIAPRLIELAESFPQGAVGDVCQPEYATFLASVVPGIAAACNAFTP